ncbi:apiosidase-like domain-containing protein [Ohtaekwangia koreensis]|uniref:Collagen-binding domain of a collagenase n=1 Tax=Ohtaekwangia koreensis TaxID=688867 RepID=A0A1T5M7E0_9BACT|nr:DUF4038 domain-containing protein [Ohtaekwangia koreensis]SKC84156.1 protein of unknown function [Ohtaekwangia koreensis]
MKNCRFILIVYIIFTQCGPKDQIIPHIPQWTTYEITLTSQNIYKNPYTDIDIWAVFTNNRGDSLKRPAFWDGDKYWKIRFTPPDTATVWSWTTYTSGNDAGLSRQHGKLKSVVYTGNNTLLKHGLLRISPEKRNIVHHDGTPFLVIGDTPWAIPFRATTDQVKIYANDRKQKGYNTALLMSVQPDRYAEGPEARDSIFGFDRAFEDLPQGHLNILKPDYFQYLDSLMTILVDHGIVPVYQPVFHGFGWKGKTVLGTTAVPEEYARYCKYLIARYGSMPACWLVSADGTGLDPGVEPGGIAIEAWDCYRQPTGIHYNPADNYLAPWAQDDSTKCFHYNRSHQAEPWLDFQWAQSGHEGKHILYKVEEMYSNKPVKAVLNGEPTYEGMGGGTLGLGWWQGEEAWTQLMHGGTMGVVYGAAGLWQWKVKPDEAGWDTWTDQPVSWREAIHLEGSKYVGFVSKAFQHFDFTDMEKRFDLTEGNKPLLAKEGTFYIAYLAEGGAITIRNIPANLPHHWFNPKTGAFVNVRTSRQENTFIAPDNNPWVLIVGERKL